MLINPRTLVNTVVSLLLIGLIAWLIWEHRHD